MEDHDCLITLGGDHTFLKSSALIVDEKPILGVNTNPLYYNGALCVNYINYKKKDRLLPMMIEALDDQDSLSILKRSRIKFTGQSNESNEEFSKLCLNEVFVAEKDVASASRYRIIAD